MEEGSQGSTVLETLHGASSPASYVGNATTTEDVSGASSLARSGKATTQKDLVNKLRSSNLGQASNTTVVLRQSPQKDKDSPPAASDTYSAPSSSGYTSHSSDRSGPLSTVENDSTRKTSVDSRFSILTKDTTKRRNSRRNPWTRSSPEGGGLGTIDESGRDMARPTVLTVEKAAAAKIYLETHFNELLQISSARDIRRHYLESHLSYSYHLDTDQMDAIRRSFYEQETWHLRETRALQVQSQIAGCGKGESPYLEKYEPLKVIGKGSFGVVRLVREKPNQDYAFPKQVFAMKVIRKSDMLRSSQEGHLRAERDFLVASEGSSWCVSPLVVHSYFLTRRRIVPLISSFQDAANLYLVMDYMPGGDFLGLLIRENILHEAVARFYVAEMIMAVEEAHRLKFIHRDIKPDNFLISASGHLKISDFGLAFDGHWSHDASYYNCHRYSLLKKLRLEVNGDETDQKDSRNIQTQLKWAQSLMSGLERHETKHITQDEDLPSLLGWRNRCGNRTAANSVVGTSQYMAPEVVQGIKYDGRCDW